MFSRKKWQCAVHKACAVILPAVYQCKVYCNSNFSSVHVRSAVVITAGRPKENSGSGFQSHRGVIYLHKQILIQKESKYKFCGHEERKTQRAFKKTWQTKRKKDEKVNERQVSPTSGRQM